MSETLSWTLVVRDAGTATLTKFRETLASIGKGSETSDAAKGLEKLTSGAENVAGGFMKMSAKIGIGTLAVSKGAAVVQGAVGAVSALSGAVGVIPGAFATAGFAAATFKVGTAGVGQALKDSGGDAKKFAADLKDLAPAQRSFVKEVVAAKPALTSLKQSVGQSLFAGLSKDVKPLTSTYLPLLRKNLDSTATGLNSGVKGVVAFAKSGTGVKLISGILGDASHAAANLGPAMKPVAHILGDIVGASLKAFAPLTNGFEDASTSAEKFVDKLTAGGQGGKFGAWVTKGVTSVQQLIGIFVSLGHTVSNIFSAGGGHLSDPLLGLALAMNKIEAASETPAFKGQVAQVFQAIATSGGQVAKQLPAVLDAVVKLAPALVNIVQTGGGSFASTLQIIVAVANLAAPAIVAISGALQPLAPILGTVAPIIYTVAKGIALWAKISEIITLVKSWTIVQTILDAVLTANPIGLVVVALGLLAAGLVLAWKHSDTFRSVVTIAFKAAADFILTAIDKILGGFGSLFSTLGKLPGKAGAPFRNLAGAIDTARGKVQSLKSTIDALPTSKKITITTVSLKVTETTSIKVKGGSLVRAAGGPVTKGVPYIVGERNPELFVPDANGTILPNVPSYARSGGAMSGAGGSGPTIVVNISQPLASANDIRNAVVDAFERSTGGARKLPAAAVRGA